MPLVTPLLRVGVIGDPVAHSLSPAIQQPALDALGVPARYELWPTTAAELPDRVQSLRAADALGANVTVPHKQAVMPLLDEVSPLARQAGAVNTIVNREGHLTGENTDVVGFAGALREVWAGPAGLPALVLGAGGAARAVVLALDHLGVRGITIANRDRGRADRLIADTALPVARAIALDDVAMAGLAAETLLLINATSLGWQPGELPLPDDLIYLLPPEAIVLDLTYRETALLARARARGLTTADGLSMLVRQGARSLELWTGRDAPLAVMHQAAIAARGERDSAAAGANTCPSRAPRAGAGG